MSQRYTGGVSTASSVSFASSGAHTFCGWVFAVDTTSPADILYADNNGGAGVPDSLWLGFDGANWVFQETVTGSGSYLFQAARSLNTWTHLAITYDGTSARAYVNGALVDTTAWNSNSRTTFNYMDIGYGGDFTVQDVMAFSATLTAAQIQTVMSTLAPPAGVTPYAWWRLTNAAPTTDASGNGHTLSAGGDANGTQVLIAGAGNSTTSGAASALRIATAAATTRTTGAAALTAAAALVPAGSTRTTGAASVSASLGVPTGSQRFSSVVRSASAVNFTSNAAHTFCGWINVQSTSDLVSGSVLYGDIASNAAYDDSAWIGFVGSNFVFREAVTGGAVYDFRSSLTLNTWTHLALTYDGSTVRSYVNGSLVDSATWSANSRVAFNYLEVASYGGDFIAQDAMTFSVALTQAQIQDAMRLTPPVGITPYSWWRLANAAPTVDASGNSHTLSGPGDSNSLLAVIAGAGLSHTSSAAGILGSFPIAATGMTRASGGAFASGPAGGGGTARVASRQTASRRALVVTGRRI